LYFQAEQRLLLPLLPVPYPRPLLPLPVDVVAAAIVAVAR